MLLEQCWYAVRMLFDRRSINDNKGVWSMAVLVVVVVQWHRVMEKIEYCCTVVWCCALEGNREIIVQVHRSNFVSTSPSIELRSRHL